MFDSLTIEESAAAAKQGWTLATVYDMGKERWALEVLPLNHPATSAVQAQQQVYLQARLNDPVAIKALQLVVRSHQPAPKKARKK
jgi:hypothetical protein